jgi:hypothetical protein
MKGDKQLNIGSSRRLLCYAAFPDYLIASTNEETGRFVSNP